MTDDIHKEAREMLAAHSVGSPDEVDVLQALSSVLRQRDELREAARPFAKVSAIRPPEARQNGDVIYIIASMDGEAQLLFSDCDRLASLVGDEQP